MTIPTGDWIVVQRKAGDTHAGGEIVKFGVTEKVARNHAAALTVLAEDQRRADPAQVARNYWPMNIEDY